MSNTIIHDKNLMNHNLMVIINKLGFGQKITPEKVSCNYEISTKLFTIDMTLRYKGQFSAMASLDCDLDIEGVTREIKSQLNSRSQIELDRLIGVFTKIQREYTAIVANESTATHIKMIDDVIDFHYERLADSLGLKARAKEDR